MNSTIREVNIKEKDLLKEMIRVYEQELTGDNNPPEYKYLDLYWQRENRKAYFIVIDGDIGGFVLVNKHCLVQEGGNNLSEFYLKPEYRNKGIGKEIAYKIFKLYPGKWENRQLITNTNAHGFWLNIIGSYTDQNFTEILLDSDKWHGWVQTFNQ